MWACEQQECSDPRQPVYLCAHGMFLNGGGSQAGGHRMRAWKETRKQVFAFSSRQVVTDWEKQVFTDRQVREHFCQPEHTEAGGCQKRGQVFVGGFVMSSPTVVSRCLRYSPLLKWPEKGIESDGLDGRAGDGTRTRDSLLGRQVPARTSPLLLKPLVERLQPLYYPSKRVEQKCSIFFSL
jgi:hypothetical protein